MTEYSESRRRRRNSNGATRSFRKRMTAAGQDFCVSCESTCDLQVDHIVPLFKGGSTMQDNLQFLCSDCHFIKTWSEYQPKNKPRPDTRLGRPQRTPLDFDLHIRPFSHLALST